MRRSTSLAMGILVMVGCLTGAAQAGLICEGNEVFNGGFERGLDGWLPLGDVSVVEHEAGEHFAILGIRQPVGISTLGQLLVLDPSVDRVKVSFDYLFAGYDVARRYDDIFMATFGFLHGGNLMNGEDLAARMNDGVSAIPQLSLHIALMSSGTDLRWNVAHYEAIYDVAGLLPVAPNALIGFGLFESRGLLLDLTDTFVGIDNVCVAAEPVPEPGTMMLFGGTLLGMAGAWRRRKKIA